MFKKILLLIQNQKNPTHIGGQAVIEGVMMRDKDRYSIAVRLPNAEIETVIKQIKPSRAIFKKPFFRGVKALIENLQIGYQSLQWSADKMEDKPENEKKDKKSILDSLSVLFSILVAVGLFIVLPNLLIEFFNLSEKEHPVLFNLASGGIRLSIFTLYVLGISFIKDVKRIFQYHGAEHKVIHAFEDGLSLNYENVKKFTTLHKRCGTSFVFLLIFVSILLFSLVPPVLKTLFPGVLNLSFAFYKIIIFLSHLVLLPVLGAFSNWIGKSLSFLALPGLFFQKITTKEPDEKQVEVAVAALQILLDTQKKESAAS